MIVQSKLLGLPKIPKDHSEASVYRNRFECNIIIVFVRVKTSNVSAIVACLLLFAQGSTEIRFLTAPDKNDLVNIFGHASAKWSLRVRDKTIALPVLPSIRET